MIPNLSPTFVLLVALIGIPYTVNRLSYRWKFIDPDAEDPAEWQSAYQTLAHRRWRRVALGGSILTVVAVVGFVLAIDTAQTAQENTRRQARIEAVRVIYECRARQASREDNVDALIAAVDESSDFFVLDPPDRDELLRRVEGRVRAQIPPPEC